MPIERNWVINGRKQIDPEIIHPTPREPLVDPG